MIYLACPSCSRQYDVTHLAPRSKVRCMCGEGIEVTWSRPFVVARLQCGTCAGPVERGDVDCRYCGVRLPEGDRRLRALCPRCYARIEEDSRHCRACGVEIRPQALTPIPDERACPRCDGELRIRVLEEVAVVECSACLGLWVEAAAFDRICHDARRSAPAAGGAAARLRPEHSEQDFRYIPCLTCGDLMFRQQYRHGSRPSGIVIDRCKDHGVWLDKHELESIVSFLASEAATPVHAPAPPPSAGMPRSAGGFRARPGRVEGALAFLGDLLFGELY